MTWASTSSERRISQHCSPASSTATRLALEPRPRSRSASPAPSGASKILGWVADADEGQDRHPRETDRLVARRTRPPATCGSARGGRSAAIGGEQDVGVDQDHRWRGPLGRLEQIAHVVEAQARAGARRGRARGPGTAAPRSVRPLAKARAQALVHDSLNGLPERRTSGLSRAATSSPRLKDVRTS